MLKIAFDREFSVNVKDSLDLSHCTIVSFFSRFHGESFAKMSGAMLSKAARGPTLIIVWEQGSGHIFGAFAKETWKIGPKFYGSNQNFLFHLSPRAYIYESTSYNEHYQYMNLKAKTLPNGLGFGGKKQDYIFLFWPLHMKN